MKTTLNTANYQHLTEIDFFGHIYKSTYNHNYYYSDFDCDLILEVCDDAHGPHLYEAIYLIAVIFGDVDDSVVRPR